MVSALLCDVTHLHNGRTILNNKTYTRGAQSNVRGTCATCGKQGRGPPHPTQNAVILAQVAFVLW